MTVTDDLKVIVRDLLGSLEDAIARSGGDFLSVSDVLCHAGTGIEQELPQRADVVWVTFAASSPAAKARARCGDAVAASVARAVMEAVDASITATRAAVGPNARTTSLGCWRQATRPIWRECSP